LKFVEKLDKTALENDSLLCVGLDIDLNKIPQAILNQEDPIFIFNREIINATKDLVCAYKPNLAFYEKYGLYGMDSLIKTIEFIQITGVPVILDAKMGDIGHSSAAYAEAVFKVFKADAVTVNPYMGYDSIAPFLEYQNHGVFALCLTSNPGAQDFEGPVYKKVAEKTREWNKFENCGLVVGATKPEQLKEIRQLVPDLPILIPGIGAQGGDLESSVRYGTNQQGMRAVINSSRAIIYASKSEDFAQAARKAAKSLRDKINAARRLRQED
jgi:orotidine 5'-phosphate decarboxylase subfamily 2